MVAMSETHLELFILVTLYSERTETEGEWLFTDKLIFLQNAV